MLPEKRACIALVCASYILPKKIIHTIFDQTDRKYKNYTIDYPISNNYINVYDYQRRSFLVGTLPNLYDYESKSYVDLQFERNQFNGYDYESSSFFFGEVVGNMLRIFDYGDTRNYYYNIL